MPISGKTAAELIAERADATQPNMGLTSWKGAKVRKGDVTIAKNYLNAEEIEGLNRIVTMYLDYAEDQAKRHRQIFMRDWRKKLDAFLQFNEREILTNAGKVSKAVADQLALAQYEIFHQHRLAIEAEQESLADDAELKRYLEKKKMNLSGEDQKLLEELCGQHGVSRQRCSSFLKRFTNTNSKTGGRWSDPESPGSKQSQRQSPRAVMRSYRIYDVNGVNGVSPGHRTNSVPCRGLTPVRTPVRTLKPLLLYL